MRVDKENYYLDIAETVLERGTCLRRNYGAIIVKNDEIVSTGYSGAPRGRKNCINLGYCMRESLNIPQGERYELCRSVHAEANAIISASRRDMLGATLYLAGRDMKTGALIENPRKLCHVQAPHHQRRHQHRYHPQQWRALQRDRRARLGL